MPPSSCTWQAVAIRPRCNRCARVLTRGCQWAIAALGAPGYDPFGPNGANLNLILGVMAIDQVSGTASHKHTHARFVPPPEAAHVTLPSMRERRILPLI